MPVILNPEQRAMNVVIGAIKDRFYPEPVPIEITPETSLSEDLGFDSLDLVELEMELEEELDISLPEDSLEKIKTVGQVADCVSEFIRSQEQE